MRMRLSIMAVVMVWLAAGGLAPGADLRVRTKLYFCHRTEAPPVIDGMLDDPCWKQAPLIEDFGFIRPGEHKQPMPQTMVQAVYDDRNLYLAFDCKEPMMDTLRERMKRSGAIWFNDCLEIYIDTQNDDTGYTALWANAVGGTFSERQIKSEWMVGGTITDMSFRLWAQWGYVPRMNADGWVVEMRIALKDLGVPPRAGVVMGFNPCRFRYVAGESQLVAWSTIGTDGGLFHQCAPQKDAAEYGHLILGPAPASLADALKGLYPDFDARIVEVPMGKTVQVYAQGKVTTRTYSAMIDQRLAEVKTKLAEVERIYGGQKADSPLMKAPAESLGKTRKKLEDAEAGFRASGAADEGTSLPCLDKLKEVENELSDLFWDLRSASLLEAFVNQ